MPRRFVLASASPARLRLLQAAGLDPEVVVSGIDESKATGLPADELARELAVAKAMAVAGKEADALVLGCDSVLEVDGGRGEVQLRSQAPTHRGDVRNYYEVRLGREGVCRVERFAYDPAEKRRRRISCHLTREVVERLAEDLAASSR